MKKTPPSKIKPPRFNVRSGAFEAVQIQENFYPQAHKLRSHFESTFKDPFQAKSSRFCWDYWTVPGQYRLLRTEPHHFFGEKHFRPFLHFFLNWGRVNLGCQMISKPWLSAYVDGCFQNMHSDVPHGPLSFVYSLSPSKSKFQGGGTFIAKPKLLRYFKEIDPNQSHEKKDFIHTVSPQFNRLLVFDPRFPHGVEPVSNVEGILDSRLVIHGWFTEPRPMIEGALSAKTAIPGMDRIAEILMKKLQILGYSGLISLRLEVSSEGRVSTVNVLTSHLFTRDGTAFTIRNLKLFFPTNVFFPRARGTTRITLPIQLL